MATLFEVSEDMLALDALIEELEGDISNPQVEAAITTWMQEISTNEADKINGYCAYIARLSMEVAAAKEQAERYQKKARTRENRIAWLKDRLKKHLEITGRKKIETNINTVAIQANGGKLPMIVDPAVQPERLEQRFQRVTISLDTDAVRKAVEAGEKLAFAQIGTRGTHLAIR